MPATIPAQRCAHVSSLCGVSVFGGRSGVCGGEPTASDHLGRTGEGSAPARQQAPGPRGSTSAKTAAHCVCVAWSPRRLASRRLESGSGHRAVDPERVREMDCRPAGAAARQPVSEAPKQLPRACKSQPARRLRHVATAFTFAVRSTDRRSHRGGLQGHRQSGCSAFRPSLSAIAETARQCHAASAGLPDKAASKC